MTMKKEIFFSFILIIIGIIFMIFKKIDISILFILMGIIGIIWSFYKIDSKKKPQKSFIRWQIISSIFFFLIYYIARSLLLKEPFDFLSFIILGTFVSGLLYVYYGRIVPKYLMSKSTKKMSSSEVINLTSLFILLFITIPLFIGTILFIISFQPIPFWLVIADIFFLTLLIILIFYIKKNKIN